MMKQVLISTFLIVLIYNSTTSSAQSPTQAPAQSKKPVPTVQSPTRAQSPATKPVVQPPSQALPAPSQAPSQEPLVHAPPRKSPKPAPPNVTEILDKAGGFSVFVRLLRETQVVNQIENQLNSSNTLTILAPTNGGFSSLKAGALNGLTPEQKVQLLQYHILPSYVSLQNFDTLTNPVRTQASNTDDYPMNITTEGNFVNISTGIVNTTISGTVYSDNHLAVYRVDSVLLPLGIFAPRVDSPTPAPAPAPGPLVPLKPKKEPSPSASSSSASPSNSSSSALKPKSNSTALPSAPALISPVAALDESGALSLTSNNGVVSIFGLALSGAVAVIGMLG